MDLDLGRTPAGEVRVVEPRGIAGGPHRAGPRRQEVRGAQPGRRPCRRCGSGASTARTTGRRRPVRGPGRRGSRERAGRSRRCRSPGGEGRCRGCASAASLHFAPPPRNASRYPSCGGLPCTHILPVDPEPLTFYGGFPVGHGTRAPHPEATGAPGPAADASVSGAAEPSPRRGSTGRSGVSPDRCTGSRARAQLPGGPERPGAEPAGARAGTPRGKRWRRSPAAGRRGSRAVRGSLGSGCAARPAPGAGDRGGGSANRERAEVPGASVRGGDAGGRAAAVSGSVGARYPGGVGLCGAGLAPGFPGPVDRVGRDRAVAASEPRGARSEPVPDPTVGARPEPGLPGAGEGAGPAARRDRGPVRGSSPVGRNLCGSGTPCGHRVCRRRLGAGGRDHRAGAVRPSRAGAAVGQGGVDASAAERRAGGFGRSTGAGGGLGSGRRTGAGELDRERVRRSSAGRPSAQPSVGHECVPDGRPTRRIVPGRGPGSAGLGHRVLPEDRPAGRVGGPTGGPSGSAPGAHPPTHGLLHDRSDDPGRIGPQLRDPSEVRRARPHRPQPERVGHPGSAPAFHAGGRRGHRHSPRRPPHRIRRAGRPGREGQAARRTEVRPRDAGRARHLGVGSGWRAGRLRTRSGGEFLRPVRRAAAAGHRRSSGPGPPQPVLGQGRREALRATGSGTLGRIPGDRNRPPVGPHLHPHPEGQGAAGSAGRQGIPAVPALRPASSRERNRRARPRAHDGGPQDRRRSAGRCGAPARDPAHPPAGIDPERGTAGAGIVSPALADRGRAPGPEKRMQGGIPQPSGRTPDRTGGHDQGRDRPATLRHGHARTGNLRTARRGSVLQNRNHGAQGLRPSAQASAPTGPPGARRADPGDLRRLPRSPQRPPTRTHGGRAGLHPYGDPDPRLRMGAGDGSIQRAVPGISARPKMPLSDGLPAQLRVGTLPRCPVRSVSGGISADGQRHPGLSRRESGGRGERLRSRLRRASQMGWKEAAVRRRVFVVVGPGPGPAGAAAARFGGR